MVRRFIAEFLAHVTSCITEIVKLIPEIYFRGRNSIWNASDMRMHVRIRIANICFPKIMYDYQTAWTTQSFSIIFQHPIHRYLVSECGQNFYYPLCIEILAATQHMHKDANFEWKYSIRTHEYMMNKIEHFPQTGIYLLSPQTREECFSNSYILFWGKSIQLKRLTVIMAILVLMNEWMESHRSRAYLDSRMLVRCVVGSRTM